MRGAPRNEEMSFGGYRVGVLQREGSEIYNKENAQQRGDIGRNPVICRYSLCAVDGRDHSIHRVYG